MVVGNIEVLINRIKELEDALRPFADEAKGMNAPSPSEWYGASGYPELVSSHLWDAHVALYGKYPNLSYKVPPLISGTEAAKEDFPEFLPEYRDNPYTDEKDRKEWCEGYVNSFYHHRFQKLYKDYIRKVSPRKVEEMEKQFVRRKNQLKE